jgi:pimeloyl-ACP methyl ester carboxylesterase
MQCPTTGDLETLTEDNSGAMMKWYMTSPFACRMTTYFMTNDITSMIKDDILRSNTCTPNPNITPEEAQKWAEAYVKDPVNAEAVEEAKGFMKNGAAYPWYWDAMMNDTQYMREKVPFDQVKCPVHIIHGTADTDIKYSQAVQLHEGIPGSILVTQDRGGHWVNVHPNFKENYAQQVAFLKKHCGMPFDEEILNKKL